MVCDPFVTALLGSDEHLSVMVWTEKGETIQDVAAFQERLKGKINPKTTHVLHHHTSAPTSFVTERSSLRRRSSPTRQKRRAARLYQPISDHQR